MISRVARLARIQSVVARYGLEELFLKGSRLGALRYVFVLSPTRWLSNETRSLPRAKRIRLALQELGPVFVKLGQMLSTRRDLLPDDIGDELALLQDRVAPFSSADAREAIHMALGVPVEFLFERFDDTPIASASVAQVHGVVLQTGESAVAKILRPGIAETISRDVSLMYSLANLAERILPDGKRLRPREVVSEYERTIHDELDLVREASNAVVLRSNFTDSSTLYIPAIHWDYTRKGVMVQERIDGISIRDVKAMQDIGMDMKKLAEHGVEIFYTQVFKHNFFHADMHPGNIFVSRDNPDHPQYIAVDFGIVGSLTDEDQRYIGENLLAFFQRDYRRVAQLHIDSGWVPRDTRVAELEAGIRAVCDPIFEKPLSEISFGEVLVQLFHVARRFEMEVQPQLVLLQKTLLNIEGLGRDLYPDLDLWATGRPFLKQWVVERNDPKKIVQKLIADAPALLRAMPEMPMLVHDFLAMRNQFMRDARPQTAGGSQSVRNASGQSASSDRGLRRVVAGASLTVGAALFGAAFIVSGQSSPLLVTVALLGGLGLLGVGLLS